MLSSERMNTRMGSRLARACTLDIGLVSAALALAACSSSQPQSAASVQSERTDAVSSLDQATQIVGQFRPQVPDDVASRAECVMVFPGLKKGGLIVGGVSGKGFASCRGASSTGWSAPAPITMSGGTLGAQAGFQSADLLAVITTTRAEAALETGNFKVGVDASAAAGPVGTGTSRSGDVGVKSDVLSYSRASGLFAGATLNGTTVTSDQDTTRALYSSTTEMGAILQGRADAQAGPAAQRFIAAIGGAFGQGAVGLSSAP